MGSDYVSWLMLVPDLYKCELLKIPCPKTPTPLYVVDPSIFHSYTIILLCTFNGSTCKQITFSAAQSKSNHCTNPGLTQTKFLDLWNLESCFNNVEPVLKTNHQTSYKTIQNLQTPPRSLQKSPVRISWSKWSGKVLEPRQGSLARPTWRLTRYRDHRMRLDWTWKSREAPQFSGQGHILKERHRKTKKDEGWGMRDEGWWWGGGGERGWRFHADSVDDDL